MVVGSRVSIQSSADLFFTIYKYKAFYLVAMFWTDAKCETGMREGSTQLSYNSRNKRRCYIRLIITILFFYSTTCVNVVPSALMLAMELPLT